MKSLVPARYNLHSELTLDVLPGENKQDYPLSTQR